MEKRLTILRFATKGEIGNYIIPWYTEQFTVYLYCIQCKLPRLSVSNNFKIFEDRIMSNAYLYNVLFLGGT